MKLLHLDSSILGAHSVSRRLSAALVRRELELHPDLEVTYHDLEADPPLHLSSAHMDAFQGAPFEDANLGRDLEVGNAYIDELFAHDILVIGAPMYNFTVPTQLKAWIDRVLVAGRTFRYGAAGPEGLLKGKKAIIASARGGIYTAGSPLASIEHHESYLSAVLSFIGITDVSIIRAEGLAISPETKEAAINSALQNVVAIAA